MPKNTPAQAKNVIRRALRAVVDPELKRRQADEIWRHFEAKCAYCGTRVDRDRREGQIEHLVPTTLGGTNHISNRVLSCGPCNGDHKREKDWREFLSERIADPAERAAREQRIEHWCTKAASTAPFVDMELLEREVARVLEAFDTAVSALRSSRT